MTKLPQNRFCPLPRAGITARGPDVARFLQGLITQDIGLLNETPVLYACLLSPQGKFLHDFFVYPYLDGYLMETEAGARRDDLLQRLRMYKLRASVDIAPLDVFVQVGFGPVPDGAYPDPRHDGLGWRRISTMPLDAPAKYTEMPFNQWDEARIALCVPDGSRDAEIEVSTLEELGIPDLNGVSFTKGCYVGQELTARMENRGLGKKHLYVATLSPQKENLPLEGGGQVLEDLGGGGKDISAHHPHPNPPPSRGRGLDLSFRTIYLSDKIIGELRSHTNTNGLALLRDEAVDMIKQKTPEITLAFDKNLSAWCVV